MVDTGIMTGVVRPRTRVGARRRGQFQARRARIGRYEAQKRAFDIAAAALALIAITPVLVVIWIVVRLTSSGPGIHWSTRVGRNGRLFRMPKFRTMRENAKLAPREELKSANEEITAIGRMLRRFSLDELPQVVCILAGQMSFVGPRPLLPMDPGSEARRAFPAALTARPGLSGISQISGRNRLSSRRKARLDAFYARSFTPWMDVRILLRTVVVVVSGRGFI
jgi:O-antigen biosynthesis protein WbqP